MLSNPGDAVRLARFVAKDAHATSKS